MLVSAEVTASQIVSCASVVLMLLMLVGLALVWLVLEMFCHVHLDAEAVVGAVQHMLILLLVGLVEHVERSVGRRLSSWRSSRGGSVGVEGKPSSASDGRGGAMGDMSGMMRLVMLRVKKRTGPLLEPVRTIGHLQRKMCRVTPT